MSVLVELSVNIWHIYKVKLSVSYGPFCLIDHCMFFWLNFLTSKSKCFSHVGMDQRKQCLSQGHKQLLRRHWSSNQQPFYPQSNALRTEPMCYVSQYVNLVKLLLVITHCIGKPKASNSRIK